MPLITCDEIKDDFYFYKAKSALPIYLPHSSVHVNLLPAQSPSLSKVGTFYSLILAHLLLQEYKILLFIQRWT